ncbi:hypothetical protein MVES1_003773 [Malassezia vespertilionis]|nr:uncharacterized protein MVES1_003773 [Malassezia vespertilionis]WFD08401.1 hypothetical protein MVES1_003773 [Malassezia vespertilionis]
MDPHFVTVTEEVRRQIPDAEPRIQDQVPATNSFIPRWMAEIKNESPRDITTLINPRLYTPQLTKLYKTDFRAWRAHMAETLSFLSDRTMIDDTLSYYLRELEPLIMCFNEFVLFKQMDALQRNLAAVHVVDNKKGGHKGFYDRGWENAGIQNDQVTGLPNVEQCEGYWTDHQSYGTISLLLTLLLVSFDSMTAEKIGDRLLFRSGESSVETRSGLYYLSIFFLRHSNCAENPSLSALQTFFLLQFRHLQMSCAPSNAVWSAASIRIAKLLGLHHLGSTRDDIIRLREQQSLCQQGPVKVKDDFINTMPGVREFAEGDLTLRELGRKVWCRMVTMDWLKSVQYDYTYCISDQMNCTEMPQMLEDEEVMNLATLPLEVLDDPDHISPNIALNVLLELGRIMRSISDVALLNLSKHRPLNLPYLDAMELDFRIIQLINSFPVYLRFNVRPEDAPLVKRIHAAHPYLPLQRLLLHEFVQYRLLRLHSSYLNLALRDPACHRSIDAYIESAEVVVAVWNELCRTRNPNQNMYFVKLHLVFAVLVLDKILAWIHGHPLHESAFLAADYQRIHGIFVKARDLAVQCGDTLPFKKHNMEYPLDHIGEWEEPGADKVDISFELSPRIHLEESGRVPVNMEQPDALYVAPTALPQVPDAKSVPSELSAPSWDSDNAALLAGIDFMLMNADMSSGVLGFADIVSNDFLSM